MLGSVLTEALTDLEQIRKLLDGFRLLREREIPHGTEGDVTAFDGVSPGHLRLFEYCTSIIRVYSVFERLVYALAEGWLGWVLKHNATAISTNPTCRNAYEIGLAEIFRRQTEPRFSDIDRFELARSHALFNKNLKLVHPCVLAVAPFVAMLPNLKIEQVCTLFTNVALGSPAQWLENSPQLLRLRDEYAISHSEALKDVVQRRNEVAHGNPDPRQILGTNELLARIHIISELAISLHQYLLIAASQMELGKDFKNGLIGEVTHQWPKSGAFALTMSSSVLAIGEKTLVLENSECFISSIDSIQIEGKKTSGFSGLAGTPLGIRMDRTPKQGARLLRASAIRDLESLVG